RREHAARYGRKLPCAAREAAHLRGARGRADPAQRTSHHRRRHREAADPHPRPFRVTPSRERPPQSVLRRPLRGEPDLRRTALARRPAHPRPRDHRRAVHHHRPPPAPESRARPSRKLSDRDLKNGSSTVTSLIGIRNSTGEWDVAFGGDLVLLDRLALREPP